MRVFTATACLSCIIASASHADLIVGHAGNSPRRVTVFEGRKVVGLSGEAPSDAVKLLISPFGFFDTGSSVATGDINGDGVADFLFGSTREDLTAQLLFMDGQLGAGSSLHFPFDAAHIGGVNVASGDIDNDQSDDAIVGAATGHAHVRAIDLFAAGGRDNPITASFLAFPTTYTGGVTVASGDLNGDGRDDIVAGAAAGLAQVRIINGTQVSGERSGEEIDPAALVADFLAFPPGYAGGVNVAAGDVNGDGFDDVIVAAASGPAQVRVINGTRLGSIVGEVAPDDLLADFLAFDASFAGGVTVAAGDVNGDGLDDLVLGAATGLSHVRVVDANRIGVETSEGTIEPDGLLADFFAFGLTYTGGVFVAVSPIPEPSSLAMAASFLAAVALRVRLRSKE